MRSARDAVHGGSGAHNATDEMPTATAAAALTGLNNPSYLYSADSSLIVDYDESSPHSSVADNELMRKDAGALLPI